MQIDSTEALIQALRGSGLFPPERLAAVVREVSALGGDLSRVVNHIVERGHLTVYQLRKVLHGKAGELILGPYVITDKLGEGGMGRVYRARHQRVGREVALKVVRPSLLSNPVIRGRYQREIEAAGTLRHPNLVRVEDAGEAAGKYYMAMEFVDGLDLSRLYREHRPLEVAEACEYMRQAALGLQHAHECGFVHRDIKPSNIVVSGERHVPQATEPALVKILDMGLIRAVGFDEGSEQDNLTRVGTVVGTPDYMAPEQAKNSSGVDHRADLYSLGCTLYFLLTGKPPFPDGTPIEKILRHQIDQPPPVQALRPEVSSAVAAVVARLTSKKPGDRYASAALVAEALAPLSTYPKNAPPVPIRVWHSSSNPTPESLPYVTRSAPRSTSSSSAVPVASPTETSATAPPTPPPPPDTPRPSGLPASLHAVVEATSPFSAFGEPVSGSHERVAPRPTEPRPAVRRPRAGAGTWLAIAAALLVAVVVGVVLLTRGPGKPTRRVEAAPGVRPVARTPGASVTAIP